MQRTFIAKIIWQIIIPTNQIASEFDVQLRIINASDLEEALLKANNLGQKHEETFLNNKGQHVSWSFINVEFVKEITSFDDGFEICSQTVHAPDALQFIKDIHVKSKLNASLELLKTD